MTKHLTTEERNTLDHFVVGLNDDHTTGEMVLLISNLTGIKFTDKMVRLSKKRTGLTGKKQIKKTTEETSNKEPFKRVLKGSIKTAQTTVNQTLCTKWV